LSALHEKSSPWLRSMKSIGAWPEVARRKTRRRRCHFAAHDGWTPVCMPALPALRVCPGRWSPTPKSDRWTMGWLLIHLTGAAFHRSAITSLVPILPGCVQKRAWWGHWPRCVTCDVQLTCGMQDHVSRCCQPVHHRHTCDNHA
jgi:hypothetical protein